MRAAALIQYLLLPLRIAPFTVIVIFSGLLTIGMNAGIMGIPMLLIIGSWYLKYSFVLLDHVIDGRKEPPVLSAEMVNPVEQRPMGTLLLLVVFWSLISSVEPITGATIATILRLLLLALVPAMVAAMSLTGRFIDALNPVAVFGAVARVPVAYLSLLAIIAALWFIPAWVVHVFSSANGVAPAAKDLSPIMWFVPLWAIQAGATGGLFGILGLMLFMYLWLAMFACIGGVLYEQRHELDIDAAHAPERVAAKAEAELERERDKLVDPIFAQVRGGALANAGVSVRKLIDNSPQPLNEFRWLYARAERWPDTRLAEYLVQLCLPRLLDARATGEALDFVRARLRVNSDFRPESSAQLLRVVTLARDAGDRVTPRLLLKDFETRFPNDAAATIAAKLRTELHIEAV